MVRRQVNNIQNIILVLLVISILYLIYKYIVSNISISESFVVKDPLVDFRPNLKIKVSGKDLDKELSPIVPGQTVEFIITVKNGVVPTKSNPSFIDVFGKVMPDNFRLSQGLKKSVNVYTFKMIALSGLSPNNLYPNNSSYRVKAGAFKTNGGQVIDFRSNAQHIIYGFTPIINLFDNNKKTIGTIDEIINNKKTKVYTIKSNVKTFYIKATIPIIKGDNTYNIYGKDPTYGYNGSEYIESFKYILDSDKIFSSNGPTSMDESDHKWLQWTITVKNTPTKNKRYILILKAAVLDATKGGDDYNTYKAQNVEVPIVVKFI